MDRAKVEAFLKDLSDVLAKHGVFIDSTAEIELSTRNGYFIGNLEMNYDSLDILRDDQATISHAIKPETQD